MNAWLVAAALGLLSAWPLTLAGSTVGLLAERVTRSPRVRELAWGAVFVLPLLFVAEMVAGGLSAPVGGEALAAANAGHPQVTLLPASFTAPGLRSLFEALLARPEALWLALVVDSLSLAGLVARVSAWIAGRWRLDGVIARASALDDETLRACAAPIPILISEEVDRPMLAGLRRSVILIPSPVARALDAERLRLIALHEVAHMRRGDNLRRPLEEALLGLFWLTPPLGSVRARMAAAAEEACDREALRGVEPMTRRLYAQTLIDTLRLGAGPEHAPAFIGADRRSRVMRMNAILNPARPARPQAIAVLCGAVAALIVGAGLVAETAAAEATASQAAGSPTPKPFVITNPDWIQRPNGADGAIFQPRRSRPDSTAGQEWNAVRNDGSRPSVM